VDGGITSALDSWVIVQPWTELFKSETDLSDCVSSADGRSEMMTLFWPAGTEKGKRRVISARPEYRLTWVILLASGEMSRMSLVVMSMVRGSRTHDVTSPTQV